MKYRRLGNSGIDVSVVGQGTWALGNDFFGEVDGDLGIKAIHASLDAGVNLIDTAPAYGMAFESELAVGKALKGRRDKVVISTKCGVHRIYGEYVKCLSPDVVRTELENSLKRLDTDYIDVYFIHWPDNNFGIEGALTELAAMKKEGKIRCVGVSNFNVEQIKTAVQIADIAVVQPPLNLLDHSSIANGIIPYCQQNGIGVMSYGSLGGGILSGKVQKPAVSDAKDKRGGFYNFYAEPMWTNTQKLLAILGEIGAKHSAPVAQVAINWALAQPGVTCGLLGSTKPASALENAKAADWELTAEELALVNKSYQELIG